MTSPTNPPKPPEPEPGQMAVVSLGFQFAAALVGFGYLGQWLDRKLDSAPVCLMIGIFVGGGGTFYLSYRRLMARTPK